MKTKILTIILFCASVVTVAQDRYQGSHPNRVSVGINIIDDTFTKTHKLVDATAQWNATIFPSKLSYERWISTNFSVEASISANKYKEGKLIDGAINQKDLSYFAFDINAKYDLNDFINNKIIQIDYVFDPYLIGGLGLTDVGSFQTYTTVNYGFGTNLWFGSESWNFGNSTNFIDNIGIFVQVQGKSSFVQKKFGNEIQYSAGLIYRF